MKKIIFITLIFMLSLTISVFAIQKAMNFPGTQTTAEFEKTEIKFTEGWNLVHGILNPEWIETNSNNIKAIYALNPITKEYVRFYPNPENDKIGESNFAWGTWSKYGALWVYSDENFISSYWKYEDGSLDQIPLYDGWNIMGITKEMKDKTLKMITSECNLEKVYHFETSIQEWSHDLSTDDFMDEELTQDSVGLGLVIKVSSDCTLSSEGSILAPPTIPN